MWIDKAMSVSLWERAEDLAFEQTHCLTETFFDEAIAHAKELDKYFAKEGKVKGPLHGLPISLKVCVSRLSMAWESATKRDLTRTLSASREYNQLLGSFLSSAGQYPLATRHSWTCCSI